MNRAKKRIFFLTQENLERVRTNPKIGLQNKDIIIITDEGYIGKEKSFDYYLKTIAKQKNQTVIGYNIRWTQKWAFQKIGNNRNNKSFAEELELDNTSMWYFVEFLLHRFPDLKDFSLSEILIHVDALNKIIKKYNPSEIIVENSHGTLNKLIVRICKKNNIRIRSLNLKNKDFKLKHTLRESIFLTKTYLKLRIFLRKIIASIFCKKFSRKDVVILTSTRLSNKENSTDYFWGPLIQELDRTKASYKVVEYDQINLSNTLRIMIKRYVPQRYDSQFIGTYYDAETQKLSKQVAGFLKKKFRELDKRKDFRNSFTYRGIYFYDLISARLRKIFLAHSTYIGDVYAMGKAVIRKEKPKLILIDHEKNYYGKSLLIEAKKKNICSVSMEGEMAYSTNTKLVQIPVKGILNQKSPLWRPVADKKLISGKFSKKWHEEKFLVPSKNLQVIGTPKYDFLRKLSVQNKRILLKNYGVRPDEKLVVVITSKTPMEASYLEAVLRVLKGKKVYVVIKQHPEHASENIKNRMEKIMKRDRIKGCVKRYENTSALLYSADLVVTVNSTIINECILMDKRTILFEPRSDLLMPWVDEGIIKACNSTAELERKIKDSFSKKSLFDRKKRKGYIKKYFYSNDGKASKRAVDEIQKCLNSIKYLRR